jgi:hypothetical protein
MTEGSSRSVAVNAPLSQFSCGHVGRSNESWRSNVSVFIRVAEIRRQRIDRVGRNCPDCS